MEQEKAKKPRTVTPADKEELAIRHCLKELRGLHPANRLSVAEYLVNRARADLAHHRPEEPGQERQEKLGF